MSALRVTPRWMTAGGAAVLALVAAWLHLRSGYAFPRPWPDEAHFLTPAITLARHGRLAVPELNAPDGIFWVPTGYYISQVPLLLLRVDPLAAARLVSVLGVVTFAVGAGLVSMRAGVHRLVAFTAVLAWLLMPRVVATANIARMEAVILGLIGVCLVLLARDRWPFAVAVSLLAPLVHPIGVILPVAVAAASIVRPGIAARSSDALATTVAKRSHRRASGGLRTWSRGEQVAVGVAVALTVAQLVYFAAHADVAAAHLDFQINRKAGRPITVRWWQAVLLVAAAAGGLTATMRWRRGSPALVAMWVALAVAGGFAIVDIVGREMWYEPLGRETAVLLLGLVAATAISRLEAAEIVRYAGAVLAVSALVFTAGVALRNTLAGQWYGMSPDPGSRAEWHDFTAAATAALQQLDAQEGPEQLVVVDPLSGFTPEVLTRRWSRLRFVQPTPATPMDTLQADYVLSTPGVPFTTQSLVEQWGAIPPVIDVGSTTGSYRLHLTANPAG